MAEVLPAPSGEAAPDLSGNTVRNIVHLSTGGQQVRIRVSNAFGTTALRIGSAHVAIRRTDAAIDPSSDHPVRFSGQTAIAIPAGADVLSDPVALAVRPGIDLAISLFFSDHPAADASVHASAFQTSFILSGDASGTAEPPVSKTLTSWYYLAAVQVEGNEAGSGTIVALGDSITDGSVTQVDANHRWTDFFAARLIAGGKHFGVANEGIGGNRILHDGRGRSGPRFGRSALARFDRDVLSQPGLRYLIVLEGINDIGHPGSNHMPEETVSSEDIIAGLRQIISRAREHSVKVFGATLTPFAVTKIPNYYSPQGEQKRVAVNQWIRTSGEFDGVIDFEKAVRDPKYPNQMLPQFDSGDHLHPNDAGQKAMGESIDLALFH